MATGTMIRMSAGGPQKTLYSLLGGDTDLYGYCVNDPVNNTDPNGLWAHLLAEGLVELSELTVLAHPCNENEDELIEKYERDRELEELMEKSEELGKQVDELCRQTGGCDY